MKGGDIPMTNELNEKRKVAFIIEYCQTKGIYPIERLITLYELLQEHERFIFLNTNEPFVLQFFEEAGIKPIMFESQKQLHKTFRNMSFDLIILDGKDMQKEQLELISPFTKRIVTLDQFSDITTTTPYNVYCVAPEPLQFEQTDALIGTTSFAIPRRLKKCINTTNTTQTTPHIVIYFEDGDPENLTYRTFRHLTQLQIPLKITIILDELYKHPIDDLQFMALSRRNSKILRGFEHFYEMLPQANILIGNALYTPYRAATIGVPYIALAQNELQVQNFYVKETNGFIHLGLGRKIKQSSLQNAVMELLLHEERRNRAIKRQKMLRLSQNNESLKALLHDLALGEYKVTL